MNSTPIILLVGQAGSGKDTVASFMIKNHGAISIAQADPMKVLGRILFDFTEEQLWGPSECRNAPDPRYDDKGFWSGAWETLNGIPTQRWLQSLFGNRNPNAPQGDVSQRFAALRSWMNMVMTETFWAKKPLTPRFMLQTLGTEWGRAQGRDLWSKYAIKMATELLGGGYRYDRTQGLIEDKAFAGPARVVISDGRFRNEVVNVLTVGGSVIKVVNPVPVDTGTEKAGVAGHASEAEQKLLPQHFFTSTFFNDKSLGLDACEQAVGSLVQALDRD